MGNEAILDRETGLVWQRDTDPIPRNFIDAQIYCYQALIGGRKGWRLPTIDELATLVDPTKSDPALPDGHLFTNVLYGYSWTRYYSSTISDSGVWRLHFGNGDVDFGSDVNLFLVRAVRSEQ